LSFLSCPPGRQKRTDSRSKKFAGESVEVDAIRPEILRQMVRICVKVKHHIDREEPQRVQVIEKAERATLDQIARNLGTSGKLRMT